MKKLFLFFIVPIIIIFLFCGCSFNFFNSSDAKPTKLEDIAYNVNPSYGYRIYLEENTQFVPYLVLTNRYNGNCLLLREYLLDEPMIYNQDIKCAAYYEDSEIDRYLNEDFYQSFSINTKSEIKESKIVITDKESLEFMGDKTKSINRRVFLLSYAELNNKHFVSFLKEGNPLKYFNDTERRIAYYDNGTAGSWWLRTPDTTETSMVCGVSIQGGVSSGGVIDISGICYNGVRPALTMSPDAKITTMSFDGETIYTLSFIHPAFENNIS